jgi:hypothetical protein
MTSKFSKKILEDATENYQQWRKSYPKVFGMFDSSIRFIYEATICYDAGAYMAVAALCRTSIIDVIYAILPRIYNGYKHKLKRGTKNLDRDSLYVGVENDFTENYFIIEKKYIKRGEVLAWIKKADSHFFQTSAEAKTKSWVENDINFILDKGDVSQHFKEKIEKAWVSGHSNWRDFNEMHDWPDKKLAESILNKTSACLNWIIYVYSKRYFSMSS